ATPGSAGGCCSTPTNRWRSRPGSSSPCWPATRYTPRSAASTGSTSTAGTGAGARSRPGRSTTRWWPISSGSGAWTAASPTGRGTSAPPSPAERGAQALAAPPPLGPRRALHLRAAGERLGHVSRTAAEDEHLARAEVLRLAGDHHHRVASLLEREVGGE